MVALAGASYFRSTFLLRIRSSFNFRTMCVVGVCAAAGPPRSLAASDGISTFELSYILYAAEHILTHSCRLGHFVWSYFFSPLLLLQMTISSASISTKKKWVFFSRSANHRRIRRRRPRCSKCISARTQSDKRWEMRAKETATQKKMKIVKTKGGHCRSPATAAAADRDDGVTVWI